MSDTKQMTCRSFELIDLGRLIEVLEKYGADTEVQDSPAKKAIDQLRELCPFKINQKVFVHDRMLKDNELATGVVVAYCQHPPTFIVGPGDDRANLPKDCRMKAYRIEELLERGELPEDCKTVDWQAVLSDGIKKGGAK